MSRGIACRVPQGSVLGPTQWNALYDNLLAMMTPSSVFLVGFADDLAVVGVAHIGILIEEAVNSVLQEIGYWMDSHDLSVAQEKSANCRPKLFIKDHPISIEKSTKYFGLTMEKWRTYTFHVERVSDKATKTVVALARIMPNAEGPAYAKRRLLMSVAASTVSYVDSTWTVNAVKTAKNRRFLIQPQRQATL